MLMKILVFCVDKCSKMEKKSFYPNLLQKHNLSLQNKLSHCPALPIPNLSKRPISNALNQSLIFSLTRCS